MSSRLAWISMACVVLATACSAASSEESGGSDLTGTTAVERPVTFQSYVYVDPSASDPDIQTAIARQIKTALGALRDTKVAFDDRGAQSNLDPSKWTRSLVDVLDPSTQDRTGQVLKVSFSYSDKAVVTKSLSQSAIDFVMLAGDYSQHADALKQSCSDDTSTDTDSLWYHFQPSLSSCQALVQSESTRIQGEQSKLAGHPGAIGPSEAGRWFSPVTAKLGPANAPTQSYSPEYDRLFALNGDPRGTLTVYAFFGVDTDENDPDDILGQEAVRFLRTMLAGQPNFRPTHTDPFAMLLDVYVDGNKLANVTYDDMFRWVLDKTGYPAEVGSDAGKIAALRRQVMSKLAERWIYWDLPIVVKDGQGNAKSLTVEVRSFYGYEDGSADARQHAQWRYLEAFWYGDVFLYNGHSHFGHGPLEPTLYGSQNFNDRYQIMMVNSCLSYNYYHEDFLRMKPGGSKNLEIVVNGSPSYVWGGGEATADFLLALLSGKQPTYASALGAMRIDLPWGEKGYDPMRVVDGELDNGFSQSKTPLSIVVQPPVY